MKDTREKRWMLWSLVICISILFSSMLPVSAQDAVTPQGKRTVASLAIVSVDGDAEILSKIDAERSRGESRILADAWKPAIPRTPLSAGDQIRTGARGSLQLQLNDGTLVKLAGDTVAVVEELRSSRGESPQTTQIKLEQGRLSTQQSTKILGQTNQIIRTNNGTINTSLGEIDVWKPSSELPRIAAVGGLPLLAKAPKNETYVDINRGGATVTSSGDGRIIASSMMTPETCIDEDGVKFTLVDPNAAVTITKLEDENAYILTAKKQFYVLVATEGTANSVDIITMDSAAKIDIEGIGVAEQEADGASQVKLHQLLTVGVKTYKVKIKLECEDTTPGGLNQFEILGDATVLRNSFGLDTTQPLPSGTSGSGRVTPTPDDESDASLSVEFGADDITCGPNIDISLTVSNTGGSNAENVVLGIRVIAGSDYVDSLSPETWMVGTIPPGGAASTTITVQTNEFWTAADAGAEIVLEAIVTGETSGSESTIGKRDTVTASNPGLCAEATPTPTPTSAETETEPEITQSQPPRSSVTHTHPTQPEITSLDVISSTLNGGSCAPAYEIIFQFEYRNYLPSIMGGSIEYRFSDTGWSHYSPNYYVIPDPTGQMRAIAYNYPASGGNQQLETGTFEGDFCFTPTVGPPPGPLYLAVELRDREGNSSGFAQCIFDVTTGNTASGSPCQ